MVGWKRVSPRTQEKNTMPSNKPKPPSRRVGGRKSTTTTKTERSSKRTSGRLGSNVDQQKQQQQLQEERPVHPKRQGGLQGVGMGGIQFEVDPAEPMTDFERTFKLPSSLHGGAPTVESEGGRLSAGSIASPALPQITTSSFYN
jgi:hypothetical protein